MSRRTLVLTALVAALSLAVLGIWLETKPGGLPVSALPSASGPASSPTPSPTVPPLAATATYPDGPFGSPLTHAPTEGQAQAKLWRNDGIWWATMVDPASQQLRIARLDWSTQRWIDTGTLVDGRIQVKADVVWDGTHLLIVTAGAKPTAGQAARLSRFHYDAGAQRFAMDPDFPITVVATGIEDAALARDSKGTLWLSYRVGGVLVVRHTLANDVLWSPGSVLAVDGVVGAIRSSALESDGTRIAVVWNRLDDSTLRVAFHADGAPDTAWTLASTAVDGLGKAPGGLSVRSVPGATGNRLLVAFETTPNAVPKVNPLDAGALVMVLDPDGTWSKVQLGRVQDHLTAPILAIDRQHGLVYAIAATTVTGQITYKWSPAANIAFESGRGTELIATASDLAIRNPATTSQDIDSTAGLVVLAADDGTGRYLHGVLSTGVAPPTVSPTSSPSPGSSAPPPPVGPPVVNVLINDTFDPWPVGLHSPAGWAITSQGNGVGQLLIAGVPSPTNHSLELVQTSVVGAVRSCKSFAPTADGVLLVNALVRISAIGTSDIEIAAVRGPGGETASLRVTRHGLLAYFNGTAKITTTALVRRGTWYRVAIVVRFRTHTFDWSLATAGGQGIAHANGARWRDSTVAAVDSVCAQTPQTRGVAIFLDTVTVRH